MVPTRQPRAKGGSTPLHRAFSSDHPDLARFLVEHGADVAAQDKEGWTLLHWASESGHVGVEQFLVGYGADVAAQDKGGFTPLHGGI